VGFQRVTAVCDADSVIPERPTPVEPPAFKGEITFENVSFGYDPEVPVLRDVSFTIAPGQLVGIVGPTGSGKSTLVSLIPRFRDLHGGRITIDGADIADYTLHGLRTQIGFVLQNTVLLRGTIRDNIAFGRPDASDEEIIEAAKLANADEFISRMPDGYASLVGDRGSTLSGGQRQRIGIARALVRDNPILILDEPTAALDAESEHLVIEAMERLMEGRTVLTIAHRLGTLRDAHKIIVIKDGVVVEDGTQEELLELDGVRRAAPSAIRPTCLTCFDSRARERLAPGRTHHSTQLRVNDSYATSRARCVLVKPGISVRLPLLASGLIHRWLEISSTSTELRR
jgi:ABC-type multidrug transport system fused ATPase/permease subunit